MARKAASPRTSTRSARPPRNRRRFDSSPAGTAASASPAAGAWTVWASARTAALTLCVAFGGAGGRACVFGRALLAGRCCGGADAVEAITGREVVAAGGGAVVAVLVAGGGGVVARATGAGSGPILDGALTGARSGPAAR